MQDVMYIIVKLLRQQHHRDLHAMARDYALLALRHSSAYAFDYPGLQLPKHVVVHLPASEFVEMLQDHWQDRKKYQSEIIWQTFRNSWNEKIRKFWPDASCSLSETCQFVDKT